MTTKAATISLALAGALATALASLSAPVAAEESSKEKCERAVAQMGHLIAHIYFPIGFKSRLIVAMNWALKYVTFQRGARLITGISGSRMEDMPLAQPLSQSPIPSRGAA